MSPFGPAFEWKRWGAAVALAGALAAGPALALAPSMALAQSSTVEITIDTPASSMTISNGQTLDIGGWALDASAKGGTGIDSVEIYVDAQNGVASQEIQANYGTYRPDVAQVFGRPDWANSGFNLNWNVQGLSEGQHTFQVWAHSTLSGWNSSTVTLAAVNPPPTTASSQVQASYPPLPAPPIGAIQPVQPPYVYQPPMAPPDLGAPPAPPMGQPLGCGSVPTVSYPGMVVIPC